MKDYTSPCIGMCIIDDSFVCEGCGRTEEEVEDWYEMEPEDKKKALLRIGLDLEEYEF